MQLFLPSVNIPLETLCLRSSLKVRGQVTGPLITLALNVRYDVQMEVIIKIIAVRNLKACKL
jgi:hypothetical protein